MALSFSLPSSYLFPRSFNFPTRFRAAAVTGEQSAHFLQAPGKVVVRNGESGMDLEVLYDDGSGTLSVKDYLDAAREIIRSDGGPPRWFCPPECGQPIKDAPLLLFLPGIDGTGFGLILHHKSLGRVFEVRCLHVPVSNRSPFEELVGFVEHSVKFESRLSPNKPIYLVGDSFGGCLALAVAARNPEIDLVLVLVNPASSFGKSQLQPFLPLMEALPSNFHVALPYVLSFVMGDPVKMAMASVIDGLPPQQTLDELLKSLTSLLPMLSVYIELEQHSDYLKTIIKSQAKRLKGVEQSLLKVENQDNGMKDRFNRAFKVYELLGKRLDNFMLLPAASKKPLTKAESEFNAELDRIANLELNGLQSSIEALNARLKRYLQSSQDSSSSMERQTLQRRNPHVSSAEVSHLKSSLNLLSSINSENSDKIKLIEGKLNSQEK